MKLKDKRTFIDSVKNCLEGIAYTLEHERNFLIEMIIGIIVIILSFIFKISKIEWLIIILVINLVLILEMINTAFEKTVDLYTKEYNELAKAVKDIASGAVFVSSLFSLVIGIIIFLPRILDLIK